MSMRKSAFFIENPKSTEVHRMDGFAKFLLLLALIAFLGAFWPGKYQYYNTHTGILVRVNRYTSATEYYTTNSGWTTASPSSGAVDPTRPVQTPSPNPSEAPGRPTPSPTRSRGQ
jgi:hypothetical protein